MTRPSRTPSRPTFRVNAPRCTSTLTTHAHTGPHDTLTTLTPPTLTFPSLSLREGNEGTSTIRDPRGLVGAAMCIDAASTRLEPIARPARVRRLCNVSDHPAHAGVGAASVGAANPVAGWGSLTVYGPRLCRSARPAQRRPIVDVLDQPACSVRPANRLLASALVRDQPVTGVAVTCGDAGATGLIVASGSTVRYADGRLS